MRSKWYDYKEAAVSLRKTGMSMTVIERKLDIPRSTLSGWFKNIIISEEQRLRLMKNRRDGWAKARIKAAESHRAHKTKRLLKAKQEAMETLEEIEITDAVLDLAFAMLYFGEGAKSGGTSISSSDPKILRFVINVLKRNYSVDVDKMRFDLHLRMDQSSDKLKKYWAQELNVPLGRFKYAAFDRRSEGKPTYEHYKGVCVLNCGQIAIQRKLLYLYNLFCEKVAEQNVGA